MQPAVYDSVNCDYEQAGNYQQAGNAQNAQNFGNPYDCPEGMYGGSMVSSVGYSKVCVVRSMKHGISLQEELEM